MLVSCLFVILLRSFTYLFVEMCKFHNNLFLVSIVWCVLVIVINASPIDFLLDEIYEERDSNLQDSELRYDQRQNGTENIRLNVDGVVIAYLMGDSSAASNAGSLASDYLLQFADSLDSQQDDDSPDLSFLTLGRAPDETKIDDKKPSEVNSQKKVEEIVNSELKNVQLRSNGPIVAAEKDDDEPNKEHLRKKMK